MKILIQQHMPFDVFPSSVYVNRRTALKKKLGSGIIILAGNNNSAVNYKDNWYPFRQDSTFLYYMGLDVAGLDAIIDVDNNEETIFGNELTIDDIIWMGSLPTIQEMSSHVGLSRTRPHKEIENVIREAQRSNRTIHWLPPYRPENTIRLSHWLSLPLEAVGKQASLKLIESIISQRAIKEDIEVEQLSRAVSVSEEMHLAVMKNAVVGMKEYELVAIAEAAARTANCQVSYQTILTRQSQVLHNHYYGNTFQDDDLLLCDAGAETSMHYAGDLTRTIPVSGKFTPLQKEMYEIVRGAFQTAIDALKPGVPFKDIHLKACRKLVDGLKQTGLMKGDTDRAVKEGAHTMFFQCGLGHMIGLDVHDMEDLGEEYVGYTSTIKKDKVFGLKSLRLGRPLEPGFALTVEPGIYIIPELIDRWGQENKYSEFINYKLLNIIRNFTGIRIEDNYLITANGSKRLGKSLPLTISEIESIKS